jgi:hypothetical protein
MANHPNRSRYSYFRVCPRGFANEVIYFRVPADRIDEVDKCFAIYVDQQFDNGETSASCGWTSAKEARRPGVAIDWADRAYAGF